MDHTCANICQDTSVNYSVFAVCFRVHTDLQFSGRLIFSLLCPAAPLCLSVLLLGDDMKKSRLSDTTASFLKLICLGG